MQPVLKNILAAVVGWLVMAVVIFITFAIAWMAFGAGGAFATGSWDVTGAWIGVTIVLGIVAAIAGGFVCSKLAANDHGILILIALVIVLGVRSAIPEAPAAAGPRPEDVSMFEAMGSGQQPAWVRWLNPVIGAIGAFLGGKLETGKSA